jgi:hypothetical protein
MSGHRFHLSRVVVVVSFVLGAALLAAHFAGVARVKAQGGSIEFSAEIPRAPEEMTVFRLDAAKPPIEFFNEKLRSGKLPLLKEEKKAFFAREGRSKEGPGLVRAFADPRTGEAQLMPNFAELLREGGGGEKAPDRERALSVARAALTDEHFIARDATEVHVERPIEVMGAARPRERNSKEAASEPRLVLTITPATRYAGKFPVYGRGSHAAVSVANDGRVVGALRRWRVASEGEKVRVVMNPEEARRNIERQLAPQVAQEMARALVDKVEVAYYDGNEKFLQPVYYFEATVTPRADKIAAIKVAGYVPLAKEMEPIPDLAGKPEGERPQPAKQISLASPPKLPAADPADISLGEYANRDWPNNNAYLTMSNSFYSGLMFFNSFEPGLVPPVNRTQWYDAYPWEVVGPSSKYFMNAVNVAYTVPHGNWLLNTTLRNDADPWWVPDIGTGGNPGFGSSAGGVLATWVIMSCEVIPSVYDRMNEASGPGNASEAFDPWWPVFQGLHNAIGFRTEMIYPDDSLQWGFGSSASLGGDVNAAWFQEVGALEGGRGTYTNDNLKGHPQSRYDKASTMIDARNLGQSIYDVTPQGPSTTLWNFWMGD